MHAGTDTAALCGSILNAAWWVRHYRRPTRAQIELRRAALHALGLACQTAFNSTDDFEPLLRAIVEGLSPREPDF